jgi:hypothetical protein
MIENQGTITVSRKYILELKNARNNFFEEFLVPHPLLWIQFNA